MGEGCWLGFMSCVEFMNDGSHSDILGVCTGRVCDHF